MGDRLGTPGAVGFLHYKTNELFLWIRGPSAENISAKKMDINVERGSNIKISYDY